MPFLWVVGFEVISYGIGFVTRQNMGWYDTLVKSPLNPPDFVFPVVWTILYALLAVSGYLAWKAAQQHEGARPARNIFWMQMFMNWGWSFVFFEFHLIEVGFFWILGLLFTLAVYMCSVWRWSKIAVWLVVPLALWTSFAAYLNYSIWMLN